MTYPIHITSEIGKLKSVIVRRPGHEVENITPDTMGRLLFDDIPYLPIAQKEHDFFTDTLRQNGAEVLYLEQLVAEAVEDLNVKNRFLEQMLSESGYVAGPIHDSLKDYLLSFSTQEMVNKIMAGIRKKEVHLTYRGLQQLAEDADYPFYMDPMPNLYFTRDPAAAIGDGLSINRMTFKARQRESMFMEYIIKYHPRFANKKLHVWRSRNHTSHIEGGDELVLNEHVFAIGISQRTTAAAIEDIAKHLFEGDKSTFDTVIAIKIPHNHAMMHLDTVLTMIDFDKFTVHPAILTKGGRVDTYILHPGKEKGELEIQYDNNLKKVLKQALGLDDLDLIPTGNGDPIDAAREQWNDGSNTLAIAPGEVVTYDRNYVSNDLLRKHGVLVHEVRSSELARGRGGPRCMSMPIVREDLKK